MEIKLGKKKIGKILKKHKYSVLILLFGLLLMMIPAKQNQNNAKKEGNSTDVTTETLEDKLSSVLSKVSGAGQVSVLLTTSVGEEVIYQTDQDSSVSNSANNLKSATVTVTDSDRNQSGLIRQINPEQYLGAIILCQGADDPAVRLAIVDAVSKATGLGANRISVLKMC